MEFKFTINERDEEMVLEGSADDPDDALTIAEEADVNLFNITSLEYMADNDGEGFRWWTMEGEELQMLIEAHEAI